MNYYLNGDCYCTTTKNEKQTSEVQKSHAKAHFREESVSLI